MNRGRRVGALGAACLAGVCLLLSVWPAPASGSPWEGGPRVAFGGVGGSDVPAPSGWTALRGSENRSGFTTASGPSAFHQLWERSVSTFPILAGPLSSGDRVFVAGELGDLYALNRSDNGSTVWHATVGANPTTPELNDGVLYVGDGRGNVSAFWAGNGSRVWASSVGGPVVQGVVVVNGTLLAGTGAGDVVALSTAQGTLEWSTRLPGRVAGAIAWEEGSAYVANATGVVYRISASGSILWTSSVGAGVDTGVAVTGGRVFVADRSGNVTALSAANGSPLWRFHDPAAGDAFETTPAVSPGLLVAMSDLGHDFGLSPQDGSVIWTRGTSYFGEPLLAGAVIAPGGVYVIDAGYLVGELNASTGVPRWTSNTDDPYVLKFAPPAIDQGQMVVANLAGLVFDFGEPPTLEPVSGEVVHPNGTAFAGASVSVSGVATLTNQTGGFALLLENGSYLLNVSARGSVPVLVPLVVEGPPASLWVVLRDVPVFPLVGSVVDEYSGDPLAGALVTVYGAFGYVTQNATDSAGEFRVWVPNGSNYLAVGPPAGYSGVQIRLTVSGGVLSGGAPLRLGLTPTTAGTADPTALDLAVLLGVAGAAAAVVAAGLGARSRHQREQGLSRGILTPFERFVAMRGLLIVPQIVVVLAILYVFGTFLPAAAFHQDPCSIVANSCSGCSWSDVACVLGVFFQGFALFLEGLFTGNWGYASFGHLTAPVSQFFAWWAPYTVELAVVALAVVALAAYPLGLYAGWAPDRPVDSGTRVLSVAALLLPSFLVVLLVLGVVYLPFLHAVGDPPYGILPTQNWFTANGGYPPWVGPALNTAPTGFPLLDGALHGDWPFEAITLAKTLLQAALIALVYVAIFLRFARHTVAEATREPFVTSARARGVSESRLLWAHTGRRVLPLFVLLLGLTIPIFIGTQALVEAMFNDPGLGTLLLAEMTNAGQSGFGYANLNDVHPGNIYEVAIFFTALTVLLVSLGADIVARLLDPRLAAGESP